MKGVLLVILGCAALASDTVVQNGRTPKGKAQTLELKKEFEIGPDSDEDHHSWSSDRVTFLVGKDGRLYIMDGGGNRIIMLDKDGKLLKSAGQKGDGPNEFLYLSSISQMNDGSLLVFEQRGGATVLTRFDKDLKQLDRSKHQMLGGKRVPTLVEAPNSKFYKACWQVFDTDSSTLFAGLLDKEFKEIVTVQTHKIMAFDRTKFEDTSWRTDFLARVFAVAPAGQGIVAIAENGGVYTANTSKYEITQWSPDLKKVRVIARDAKPIFQTPEEITSLSEIIRDELLTNTPEAMHSAYTPAIVTAAIQKSGFKERKPPLFGLVPMGDHLLAINDYKSKTGDLEADIFNPKGEFIGTTQLKGVNFHFFGFFFGYFANLRFQNGKAYALLDTEDGDYKLARYSYKIKPAK